MYISHFTGTNAPMDLIVTIVLLSEYQFTDDIFSLLNCFLSSGVYLTTYKVKTTTKHLSKIMQVDMMCQHVKRYTCKHRCLIMMCQHVKRYTCKHRCLIMMYQHVKRYTCKHRCFIPTVDFECFGLGLNVSLTHQVTTRQRNQGK